MLSNVHSCEYHSIVIFHNFFHFLSNISNGPLIIGGDFDTTLDPAVNRSNKIKTNRIWQSTSTIKQFMSDIGLGDSWQLKHPILREYSFYSPVHHSFSGIDLFLASNSIIPVISDSKIHSIIICDHAPVTLRWNPINQLKCFTKWCFNSSLLKDSEFDSYLRREWASFLERNDSPETSPSTLWETGKVGLRGKIISFSIHKKRKKEQE